MNARRIADTVQQAIVTPLDGLLCRKELRALNDFVSQLEANIERINTGHTPDEPSDDALLNRLSATTTTLALSLSRRADENRT